MKSIWNLQFGGFIAGLVASLASLPVHQASAAGQWGEVNFPISCRADAQHSFDQAIAMLHSFSFGDAAKEFTTVARKDPSCAMAYWGLATTAMGSLFAGRTGPTALGKGWELVQEAQALGGKTLREQDYIAAAEAFYRDAYKREQGQRLRAYADALKRIHTFSRTRACGGAPLSLHCIVGAARAANPISHFRAAGTVAGIDRSQPHSIERRRSLLEIPRYGLAAPQLHADRPRPRGEKSARRIDGHWERRAPSPQHRLCVG